MCKTRKKKLKINIFGSIKDIKNIYIFVVLQ